MKQSFKDRRGLAFKDAQYMLPADKEYWPKLPPRIKKDKTGAQAAFHKEYAGTPCWMCGAIPFGKMGQHQLHHLAAGSRGRSHERELFTYLCKNCHDNCVSPIYLGRLLYLKWKFDPEWVDYEWLTIRFGHILPDLAPTK